MPWQSADTLGVDEARTRLETVQSPASSAASVADGPIFAKVKSWLGRKKLAELASSTRSPRRPREEVGGIVRPSHDEADEQLVKKAGEPFRLP